MGGPRSGGGRLITLEESRDDTVQNDASKAIGSCRVLRWHQRRSPMEPSRSEAISPTRGISDITHLCKYSPVEHQRARVYVYVCVCACVGVLVCTEHPSGCADGTTEGLADYEEIQACQGRWQGHVKRAKSLCAAGWQVCSPRHSSSLKLLSWSDVADQLDGCYAYNAANTLNLCTVYGFFPWFFSYFLYNRYRALRLHNIEKK